MLTIALLVMMVFALGFILIYWGEPFSVYVAASVNAAAGVITVIVLCLASVSPLFLVAGEPRAKFGMIAWFIGGGLGRLMLERRRSKFR